MHTRQNYVLFACKIIAFLAFALIWPAGLTFFKRAVVAGGAAIDASGTPAEASPVHPTSVDVSLNDIVNHSSKSFEVRVVNKSARALRVVGTPSYCGAQGCLRAIEPPETIGSGQEAMFRYIYDATIVGPIKLSTRILLDNGD